MTTIRIHFRVLKSLLISYLLRNPNLSYRFVGTVTTIRIHFRVLTSRLMTYVLRTLQVFGNTEPQLPGTHGGWARDIASSFVKVDGFSKE